jgi:hypothetical protein
MKIIMARKEICPIMCAAVRRSLGIAGMCQAGHRSCAGMQMSYVVKDAKRWEVEPKSMVEAFDAGYYRKLLKEAWVEAEFVFSIRFKK